MKIGTMDGLIDGLSQVVYDSGELTSADTSITISGLTGDTDEEYTIICRFVNDYAGAVGYQLRPNNDSGSNYGEQTLRGESTTADAFRATRTYIVLSSAVAQNELSMCNLNLYSKSGYARTSINLLTNSISGTTVSEVRHVSSVWTNTADEITSLVLSDQTDAIGIGSRIILLRKVDVTSDMKTGGLEVQGRIENAWQKIYTNDLTSAAASVTISGLTGNTDVVYKLICRFRDKGGANEYILRPNADAGSNYGYQLLMGRDTTASAFRDTTNDSIWIGYTGTDQYYSFSETLLFAKSGYERTAIIKFLDETVTTSVYSMRLYGAVWNETPTEITSLEISTTTNQMEIGTHIELWALRL